MAQTRGFQGKAYYVAETTPGTTPTDPAYKRFSDSVESVRVGLSRDQEGFRSIDSYDLAGFLAKMKKPTVQVAFRVQRGTVFPDVIGRNADGSLKTFSIEVHVNADSTAKGFYTFKGCKADVEISVDSEDFVTATLTFMATDVAVATTLPSVGLGSREGAIGTSFLAWNGASVTKGGATWGYVTAGFSASIAHGLTQEPGLGTDGPAFISEGGRDISGNADIYVNDAGKAWFDEVNGATESTVVFKMGTALGSPVLTFSGVRLPGFELNVNDSDATVKAGVGFVAKGVAYSTV